MIKYEFHIATSLIFFHLVKHYNHDMLRNFLSLHLTSYIS